MRMNPKTKSHRTIFFWSLLAALILLMTGSTMSQGNRPVFSRTPTNSGLTCKPNRTVLKAEKPLVYLTYVEQKTVTEERQKSDYLLFRITNNACRPISLLIAGSTYGLGDAFLYYDITNSRTGEVLQDSKSCHVCSSKQLATGRSILFAIPKSVAAKDRNLSIDFEFTREPLTEHSPSWTQHAVLFSFSELPESVKLEG